MKSIITYIEYFNEIISIEYYERYLIHSEASRPCGNGVYIYNSKSNSIYRWSLSLCHDIPYHNSSNWNSSKEWHLVKASSIPLAVWWKDNKLSFDDIGCALPQTLQAQRDNKLKQLI